MGFTTSGRGRLVGAGLAALALAAAGVVTVGQAQAQGDAAPVTPAAVANTPTGAAVTPPSGATTLGDAAGAAAINPAPAFTGVQLKGGADQGWITNGGNSFNQRYSPLTQINRANVKGMKAVWKTSLNGSGTRPGVGNQGQPVEYDGVIYMESGENDVIAVSVETGKVLWQYRANIDNRFARPCCGWNGRGVAVGEGKVFLGRLDARLTALDQKTGKVLWQIQAAQPRDGYAIASAPLYYNGMVITGFAGSDLGIRGHVNAYDAKDGHLIWTFNTVPGPGEFGHDTWPKNSEVWKYGGSGVWQTPAVDPALGLIYFSTANPGPVQNGAIRAGDNLFSDSIVAVDAKTGKYRWHFQEVHHDIWDQDAPNPVILFDAIYKGKLRHGIAEAGKTGWVYLLDRATGKPLLGIPEKAVMQNAQQHTAKTQPYPIGDALVPQEVDVAPEDLVLVNKGRIFTPFTEVGTISKPSAAVNWPVSAFDPKSALMFVCANDSAAGRLGGDPTYPVEPGALYSGSAPMRVAATTSREIVEALNVKTNRLVWRHQWAQGCSGVIATGGGLVFLGRGDGRFDALDSSTGVGLWEFQIDGGIGGPATTFEHKGKQYVVVFAGGVRAAKHTDSLWLFALDGTIASLPRGAAAPPAAGPPRANGDGMGRAPPNTRVPNLAQGQDHFLATCAACHGPNGEGSTHGARLTNVLTPDVVISTANAGKGEMPSFRGAYTDAQFQDLAAYVVSIAKDRKP